MLENNKMTIRKYEEDDKEAVLSLLDANIPAFFAPSEKLDLIAYLEQDAENYFVAVEDHKILGAGGFNLGFSDKREVRIAWDFVHPVFYGTGIGKKLVQFRLKEIRKITGLDKVVVRTSQFAFTFYQKQGFTVVFIEKDYWSPGFDLYFMQQVL
jgi:[ribosomal protein S18]-alanine N-acetyltransferase